MKHHRWKSLEDLDCFVPAGNAGGQFSPNKFYSFCFKSLNLVHIFIFRAKEFQFFSLLSLTVDVVSVYCVYCSLIVAVSYTSINILEMQHTYCKVC